MNDKRYNLNERAAGFIDVMLYRERIITVTCQGELGSK